MREVEREERIASGSCKIRHFGQRATLRGHSPSAWPDSLLGQPRPTSFKKPSWATPVLRLSLFLYLCKHSNSLHYSQNIQVKHWSSEDAPVKFGVRQIHLNLGFNLHSGPVTLERSLGLSDPKFRKMGINPFPDYSQSYWEVTMNEIMRGK